MRMRERGQIDKKHLTINIKGFLMDFEVPKIMGILNVTPDSFYSQSRSQTTRQIENRIVQIVEEGADIIDIGACSTRPNSLPVNMEEEWERIEKALNILRSLQVEIPVSVDTYRSEIAKRCVEKFDVDIINDISGCLDPDMMETISNLNIPYVLTHANADSTHIHKSRDYYDVVANVITDLSKKCNEFHSMGVKDIIIDPGFGFSKDTQDNFQLLDELNSFEIFEMPILVGLSRKSMIYKTLHKSPETSLIGSVSLEAFALDRGVDILRVHDVGATKDLITLYSSLKSRS